MKYALTVFLLGFSVIARAADLPPADVLAPVVEVEEDIYRYTNAQNGAGPMWCSGSTTLVRTGDRLFVSGLETIPDAKPLNNCRWMLFTRGTNGWTRVRVDTDGRTREPSPLAAFPDGRVFLSVNPTLGRGPQPHGGPARPDVLQFSATEPTVAPVPLVPLWQGKPAFSEHSYRTFTADGTAGELLLFQNIGYTHAEWTFRDRHGKWSAQGQIKQRPDSELEVGRFAIASFKLGQENRPFLLRPCFPHDLASVQGLTLARWFLGGSVRQQIGGGKQPRVCDVRVQCKD